MASLPRTFSLLFCLLILLALSTQHLVQADKSYSFFAPTAATRWVAGQQGLVSIISTDKAKGDASPTDRLLTITLRTKSGGIFPSTTVVATIKDGIQLLIPANSTATQVQLDITDFIVPATLTAGENYLVHLERASSGLFDFDRTTDSSNFQIFAAPPAGNTTTGLPTMTSTIMQPTLTTTTANLTTTPTPTLPAGQTCNDIREQCAAQSRAYQEATATTPCSCGATLVVPTIVGNSAPGSIKANVKLTFQSTGGPTAALAFLLLVVMTLF
ncbi:hypothetical protein BC939DRAFT_460750 [Gamsiella multidivaricata]|uniref:uncharacterized protein n=1 Tax=Gamsiella multidivaricata TaxID=101098 RepID=UPI00221E8DBA|nr:uncharacterized protein BC939DRAFT_460750 [Gamsiella multidivaricata]KAI7819274.1 hypothetical protein BC939DRAFT_460750 [Gamsiella multidivaricata]